MFLQPLTLEYLESERLLLIPYTTNICQAILQNDFQFLQQLNLMKGKNWPDDDVLETIPKIIKNLNKVDYPTGFESWMIIKKETREIIGDCGFKGYNFITRNADIGYGIIEDEQKKGFAMEATKTLINWAFSDNDLEEITAACLKENTSSSKLLQKLNFQIIDQNDTMIFWSLIKP